MTIDVTPRTLRAMLADSKDTAELMLDLAYGAVFSDDSAMAVEVDSLRGKLTVLAHRMRVVSVLAGRRVQEAEELASVLRVVGAIEDIGGDAVDIARLATREAGLHSAIVVGLANGDSVVHRVRVAPGSPLTRGPLSNLAVPVQSGVGITAVLRDDQWTTRVDSDFVCRPDDVLLLAGPAAGISLLREAAGAPPWTPPEPVTDPILRDVDHAVVILREMMTLSEVAVGLGYAALLVDDADLASEVRSVAERLDDMKDDLQRWVLRAAVSDVDGRGLQVLLELAQVAADLGDRAATIVHPLVEGDEVHPVLALALGETDDAAVRVTVREESSVASASVRELELSTGFEVLAVRRDGRYRHRPSGGAVLRARDEIIASGPGERRSMFLAHFVMP